MSARIVLACAVLAGSIGFGPARAAMGAPPTAATAPASVPDALLKQIADTFRPPRPPKSQEDYVAMMSKQMEEVLRLGEEAERQHPKAPNLHVVRSNMLMAADFLVRLQNSGQAKAQRLAIARRILDSDAPPDAKATPDYYLMMEKLGPSGAGPLEAEREIRQFTKRYAGTGAEAPALVRALFAAGQLRLPALHQEFLDRLEKDYARDAVVNTVLRRLGRRPPFFADLTLLDGAKLALPDDLKGKVVVIDFWATWCGPCLAEIPRMKGVYAKYKPRGVEFVGISLDAEGQRQKVAEFVKEKGISWPQTYSGKYWEDPTAERYEVRAIPAVWVIDRDGRFLSDDARDGLEAILDKALAAPAAPAKPAAPSTAPAPAPLAR